ncbi:hypothetical protein FYJ27_10490 [Anaerosalibacter bizertensis]|uniref:Uncharacterized protein n=1 Tax=Anaerosalibacter bizertensis TaxID=932217 RepID=A0A844FJA1_9FIRM|nr:hypothetical protein [Anaerosalibacter bizertensis]MBV1817433.1 hypothetical protein [Bacteroidales bacterium MSK.15.36]HHV27779.1 hypothetical protein [Tissierellia bacterium]MBU5293413.1 hypothetical protein [Anaerosalibacter bizertensis]MCB5559267.1 hypothetical protein [Anaerosalibacter bizertensis]MCG4564055.1 hypothetical protein [Anaerosalibacter bizertensis]
MATATVNLWQMYKGLKYNFLFNNDINCIHILLNLYDLEEDITNICPKYMCIKNVKKRVKNLLRYREDKELVANKISYLIHEDVDRLELCIYLEGYKYGYYNNKWVNILEEKTLEHYSIDEIFERRLLFHYDFSYDNIDILKKEFELEIEDSERKNRYIENLVISFCDEIIKDKINNLNKYIDRQLKMDFSSNSTIKEEGIRFSKEDLDKIYGAIVKDLFKSIFKIYKDASWFGVNDKVIKRYSI